MDTYESGYYQDEITYQCILKEIIKEFNAAIPTEKEEMYLGYTFIARQIVIKLKKIAITVQKAIDQEIEEIIDNQSLCCEFIHSFKEGISQIILEFPELERILHRMKLFSLKQCRIYEFLDYGNNLAQSFFRLRNEWGSYEDKVQNFRGSQNLSSLFQRETLKKHNIDNNSTQKSSFQGRNPYQFDDIFLGTEFLKDREMKNDFVNTLNFTEKEFAKTHKRTNIEEVMKNEAYQKMINFPLMYLSHEDDLPWILKQVININEDFVEFLALDMQRKEKVSICFFLNKKSEVMKLFSNHYTLQQKSIKGIRELYDFYFFTAESGESFFVVSREIVYGDIRQAIKEREKKLHQYNSIDLLQTFKFLAGTLVRIHNQNIYLKNICPANIVFSQKDQCWKFDNLTHCVEINLEEAQARLNKHSEDFYEWGYVDLNSIFTPEQFECFKVEGYLGYLNSDLKHLIKSQHSQISYYDLQAADRYALGRIFEKILDKLVTLIEILEIKSQPEGYESKAVDLWVNDSNVKLCRQICEILQSTDQKFNEKHTTGNIVSSEDKFYLPKNITNKNKFQQEVSLGRAYQLIHYRERAEQHYKNAFQEIQNKSGEGKMELVLLLREMSYLYSEFLMDYQESLKKITEALYLINYQNSTSSLKFVLQLDLKNILLKLGKYQECIEFVILHSNNSIQSNSYFTFQALNIESQAQFKLNNFEAAAKTMQKALNILYFFEKSNLEYLFEIEHAEALQFLGIYQHFGENHIDAISNLKRASKIYMKYNLLEDLTDSLSLAAKSELAIFNLKNCLATLEICLKHQSYELQKQYLKLIDLLFTASECYRHLNIRSEENRYITEILNIIRNNDIYLDKCPDRIQRMLKFEKQIEEMSNNYLPHMKFNTNSILAEYSQVQSKLF